MARHSSGDTAASNDRTTNRLGAHAESIHNDNQIAVDQLKERLAREAAAQAQNQGDLSSMDEGGW